MAGETKNLGPVAGIYVGTTPPANTLLIWYDNNPGINCHKIYDPSISGWIILNNEIIGSTTRTALVTIASTTGLSLGNFYQLTDVGNTLALSITSTKIQYVDSANNLVVDDLVSTKRYYVASENFKYDNIPATFSESTKQLNFVHADFSTVKGGSDFIYGVSYQGGVWRLAKFLLTSLVSTTTGNSISWSGSGLFLNFNTLFNAKKNVTGGFTAKETFDSHVSAVNSSIGSLAESVESLATSIETIGEDDYILNASLTSNPSISTSPADATTGDSIFDVIGKFQSWINKFKRATGILLSSDFVKSSPISLQPSETIDSAFRKVQAWFEFLNKKIDDSIQGDASVYYDYVVNSDSSLKAISGNNVISRILIKKGEYTYNFDGNDGIILGGNVKEIYAEPGTQLNFFGFTSGGVWDSCFKGANGDFSTVFKNIKIVISSTVDNTIIGFYHMNNLENCTVEKLFSTPYENVKMGFYGCTNLKNCTSYRTIIGFSTCSNLYDCTWHHNGVDSVFKDSGQYCGFIDCKKIVNSSVYFAAESDTPTFEAATGFFNCEMVSGSDVLMYSGDQNTYGFDTCIYGSGNKVEFVLGEDSSGWLTRSKSGYESCSQFVNNSITYSNDLALCLGFSNCHKLQQNHVNGLTTNPAYSSSYADLAGNVAYACADTANGGFNSFS